MHPNTHSSTIYNNQVMEVAQVPIKKWTDKKDVGYVCVYTIILAIKKNEILHLQKQRWPRDYFA